VPGHGTTTLALATWPRIVAKAAARSDVRGWLAALSPWLGARFSKDSSSSRISACCSLQPGAPPDPLRPGAAAHGGIGLSPASAERMIASGGWSYTRASFGQFFRNTAPANGSSGTDDAQPAAIAAAAHLRSISHDAGPLASRCSPPGTPSPPPLGAFQLGTAPPPPLGALPHGTMPPRILVLFSLALCRLRLCLRLRLMLRRLRQLGMTAAVCQGSQKRWLSELRRRSGLKILIASVPARGSLLLRLLTTCCDTAQIAKESKMGGRAARDITPHCSACRSHA
jgi:hypothetical protein